MIEKHVHYLASGLGYEVYGPPTLACDPTKCGSYHLVVQP